MKGLDLCHLAKDFKTKQKASMTSTALFFNDDIKSTLVEIVKELGIATTSKQQRHLNLAAEKASISTSGGSILDQISLKSSR